MLLMAIGTRVASVIVGDVPSMRPTVVEVAVFFGVGRPLQWVATLLLVAMLLGAIVPGRWSHAGGLLVVVLPRRHGGAGVGLPVWGTSGGLPGCGSWPWGCGWRGNWRWCAWMGRKTGDRTLWLCRWSAILAVAPTVAVAALVGGVLGRRCLLLLLGGKKCILLLDLGHLLLELLVVGGEVGHLPM